MGNFLRHTWDLIVKGAMLVAGFLQGIRWGENRGIVLLLALMVADYISGVVAAAMKKSRKSVTGGLSSQVGAQGLLKKGLMLLVVLLAYVLDRFIDQGNTMFQSAVTWFYISNEALSLVENLAVAGVPIPKKLRAALERLAEEEEAEAAPPQEVPEQPADTLPPEETAEPGATQEAEQTPPQPPSQPPPQG